MSRPLTRAENQARTRLKLLDSGARVFAAKGYGAATIEEIASRAGFTRGAFYANFAGKGDLFLTILEAQTDDAMRVMVEHVGSAAEEEKLAAVLAWFDDVVLDRRLELAFGEFQAVAARDRAMRARLARRYRRILDVVTAALDDYCRSAGVPLPVPAREVATMVVALVDGFITARRLDPEAVPPQRLAEALTYLWAGLLSVPGEPRDRRAARRSGTSRPRGR